MDGIKNVTRLPAASVDRSSGTAATDPAQVAPNSDEQSSRTESVAISGRAQLLARVYGLTEDRYAETVATPGASNSALGDFLTVKDRRLLEQIYDYATSNNIDLNHVDALAQDLGTYRAFGKASGVSGLYDNSGRKLSVSFSASESDIARRISMSSATRAGGLDADFIESELIVGGHATNFSFLEHMVNVLGGKGDANKASALNPYDKSVNALVSTASSKVDLAIPEADYVSVNGVGHWRNPSAKNELGSRGAGLFGGSTDSVANILYGVGLTNQVPAESLHRLLDMLYPGTKQT